MSVISEQFANWFCNWNADNLLANYQKMDDDTRKWTFTDIYDDSMWLINLVENLLAITRIEDGQVHLTQSVELMDEVVTEALRHVNRKSREHIIHVSSSQNLILANIDVKLIVQVLINLVDNAVKYTPAGSVIEIHAEKDNEAGGNLDKRNIWLIGVGHTSISRLISAWDTG